MTQLAHKIPNAIPRLLARKEAESARERVRGFRGWWSFARVANLALGLYIVGTLAVAFRMNCVDRSLYVDEAMLAWSLSQRSLLTLTDGPLEYLQSAPVLYLYIVKLLTLALGNTEFVLRLPSFVFYVLVVFLSYRVLKDGYRVGAPVPLAGAACVSSALVLMRYASEFKQYMLEALVVMLLWYLYVRAVRGKSWAPLAAALPVAVWGANPACFFGGCICLYELIRALAGRDRARALRALAMGCLLVLSFAAYYFYWLRPAVGPMHEWWFDSRFPLNWLDVSELTRGEKLVRTLLAEAFHEAGALVLAPLAAVGLVYFSFCESMTRAVSHGGDSPHSQDDRKHITRLVALSLLFMLVVSGFGLFPLAVRLWLFSCPIIVVLAFAMIGACWEAAPAVAPRVLVASVAVVAIAASTGVPTYSDKNNVYLPKEEINPSVAYLQKTVAADEFVYVHNLSIPQFQYKNGYGNASIGAGRDNVVFGTTRWNIGGVKVWKSRLIFGVPNQVEGVVGEEVERILGLDKCWVPRLHDKKTVYMLDAAMASSGYTELVLNARDTPLYFHFRNPEDARGRCTYELMSAETTDGVCAAWIRIRNTGQAYIGNGLSALCLSDESGSGIPVTVKDIAPRGSTEVLVGFEWDGRDSVSLGLEQEGQYRLSELGIEPITIARSDALSS